MSLLCFLLCCTMTLTKPQMIEDWIPFETPAIETEEPQAEPAMHLYGSSVRITFYDNGPCCCGQWAYGATASGAMPQVNHTAACGDLPFGTRILVDGQEYVIEDRGVGAQQVDIYVGSHEEANQRGLYYTEVWIIDD